MTNRLHTAFDRYAGRISVYGALLSAATALATCGCATIYKSTADTYVDAAKQIGPTLASADAALAAADAARKRDLIATDSSCPVERPGVVYLLPAPLGIHGVAPDFFTGLIHNAGFNAPTCQRLIQCESRGSCGTVCYRADESSCIDNLQHFYNIAATEPGAVSAITDQRQTLNSLIGQIGYGAPPAQDYLAQSSLDILSAYLDLLGKAADGQVKDFQGNAAQLLAAAQGVFKKARDSNGTLVQLVENPSNDQLKEMRAEQFASFRSAAEDLVNLIVTLK